MKDGVVAESGAPDELKGRDGITHSTLKPCNQIEEDSHMSYIPYIADNVTHSQSPSIMGMQRTRKELYNEIDIASNEHRQQKYHKKAIKRGYCPDPGDEAQSGDPPTQGNSVGKNTSSQEEHDEYSQGGYENESQGDADQGSGQEGSGGDGSDDGDDDERNGNNNYGNNN